jgi:hypothetical protein
VCVAAAFRLQANVQQAPCHCAASVQSRVAVLLSGLASRPSGNRFRGERAGQKRHANDGPARFPPGLLLAFKSVCWRHEVREQQVSCTTKKHCESAGEGGGDDEGGASGCGVQPSKGGEDRRGAAGARAGGMGLESCTPHSTGSGCVLELG